MIAAVVLNPSIDRYLEMSNLHLGRMNRGDQVLDVAGGKGVNVSRRVQALGGKTRIYAFTGGLIGAYWKKLLQKTKISHQTFSVDGQTRINYILNHKGGGQTQINLPGPRLTKKDLEPLRAAIRRRSRDITYLVLSGALPPGISSGSYAEIIDEFQARGVRCVLDAEGEALALGLQASPFMIKPNKDELEDLFKSRFRSKRQYLEAAKYLMSKNRISEVVISLGSEGALFASKDLSFYAEAPMIKVQNTVGAGDALVAGYVFGFLNHRSRLESANIAMASALSMVMRQQPDAYLTKGLRKLISKIKISLLS